MVVPGLIGVEFSIAIGTRFYIDMIHINDVVHITNCYTFFLRNTMYSLISDIYYQNWLRNNLTQLIFGAEGYVVLLIWLLYDTILKRIDETAILISP